MSQLINNIYNSASAGQPIRPQADLDFLQLNDADGISSIIEKMIGSAYDSTKSYVLKGCVSSSSSGTTSVTAGLIYGKAATYGSMPSHAYIYFVPAVSFADPSGGNVVICQVLPIPNATWDPTTFTDASTPNIHIDYRLQFQAGTAGSGFANYTDLVFIYPLARTNFPTETIDGKTITFERDVTKSYPDPHPSTATITVSATNAAIGTELLFICNITGTTTFVFSGGNPYYINGLSSLVASNAGFAFLRIKYLGNTYYSVEIYNPA